MNSDTALAAPAAAAAAPAAPAGMPLSGEVASGQPDRRPLPIADAGRSLYLGLLAVIVASASWGLQGVLVKYAFSGGANVVTVLALRATVGTLFIWSLLPLFGRRMERATPPPARRRRLGFVLLGILTVFNSLTYYLALARLPASTAVLFLFLFPALTVLWATLFFDERFDRRKGLALALALGGAILTLDPAATFASGLVLSGVGIAFALASAFGNSWYAPVAARLGRGHHGYTVARHALPATASCFVVYVLASGNFSANMTVRSWVICALLGVLTGGALLLYLVGITQIGPSRASITTVAEPVTVVLLSSLLLSEPLTPIKILGGASIITSILLLSRVR